MAGRKPTPTALKVVRGNPGRRPLNAREPRAKRGVPKKPAWLTDIGAECWAELCELLDGMQVLTVADGPALALLCATFDDYRTARNAIEAEGQTYESETEKGFIIRARPEMAIMADAARRMRNLMTEFGLTPSARSRLHVEGDAPPDPLEEYFRGGKHA